MGKGGEGRRRERRAGEGKFAPAPSKYIWIDAAGYTQDTICQFWLFAGQCKSIAYQWKLCYIFGSKVAICVGDEFDYSTNQTIHTRVRVRVRELGLGFGLGLGFVTILSCVGYNPSGNTHDRPAYNVSHFYLLHIFRSDCSNTTPVQYSLCLSDRFQKCATIAEKIIKTSSDSLSVKSG